MDVEKFGIRSDEQMALDLLRRERILITAGTGFSWKEPDHFRIVFLPDLVQLQSAAEGLERFFASYRQS